MAAEPNEDARQTAAPAAPRRWIGILFDCCGVYARLYRRADQSEYVGRCPCCLREVRVGVGPGGTNQRIFRAT